jgi:prepilin-type processing-associated H-X9-DG protein
VIAIIGILVLLLLPAVQQAREAARRLSCKNNLKQIAMAAVQHHQNTGQFPTGGWGWNWVGDADRGFNRHQPGGWAFNLLPYMEQRNLYDKAGDGDRNLLSSAQKEGALFVQRTVLNMYTCPSRRGAKLFQYRRGTFMAYNSADNQYGDTARSDYAINCGDQSNNEFMGGPGYSIGLYQNDDADGSWNPDKAMNLTGIAFERSEITSGHIIDGLSNTYFAGEKYINPDNYETGADPGDNEGWCTGYNNDNYRNASRLPIQDRAGAQDTLRFGSPHATGFNVALCDGSVHSLGYSISLEIHRRLANRRNGDNQGIDIDDL